MPTHWEGPAAPPPACAQLSQPGACHQQLRAGLKPHHIQVTPWPAELLLLLRVPPRYKWRLRIIQLDFVFELGTTSTADFKKCLLLL